MNNAQATSKFTVLSASANVQNVRGALLGIWVSSVSGSPTITVYDDAATGTTVPLVTVFTPIAATWYPMPFNVANGVYVVIGATVSCTVATQSGA